MEFLGTDTGGRLEGGRGEAGRKLERRWKKLEGGWGDDGGMMVG